MITVFTFKIESKRLINLDNSKDNGIFIGADGDVCNEYVYNGEFSVVKRNSKSGCFKLLSSIIVSIIANPTRHFNEKSGYKEFRKLLEYL